MTPSFLFHKKVGVGVETNLRMAESTANFGYQIDLPKANLVFRGNVRYIIVTVKLVLISLPFE
jgi:hypothetical protein